MIQVRTYDAPDEHSVILVVLGHASPSDGNKDAALQTCASVSAFTATLWSVLGHTREELAKLVEAGGGAMKLTIGPSNYTELRFVLRGIRMVEFDYPEYISVVLGDTRLSPALRCERIWNSP